MGNLTWNLYRLHRAIQLLLHSDCRLRPLLPCRAFAHHPLRADTKIVLGGYQQVGTQTEGKAGIGSRIFQNHGAPAVQRFQPDTDSKYADLYADLVRPRSAGYLAVRSSGLPWLSIKLNNPSTIQLPGRCASLGRAEWSRMPCKPSFLYHFQLLRSRQWMSSSARRRISRAACERGAKSTNALKYPYSCPGRGASSSISMAIR